MTQKLNGWKTRCLSLARRVTLAKAALATIPSYIMQIVKLPKIVCTKIDCICFQFIWGSSNYKKRVHLVSWDKVCRPKEVGGLGFKKAKEMNLALMTKLAWEIVNKPKTLWVRVMRNKYRCREDTPPNIRRRGKSSNA